MDIQIPVDPVSSDRSWVNPNAGSCSTLPSHREPPSISSDIHAVRQALWIRIQTEGWFLRLTKERVLNQREASTLGKRAGESVLLAFSDPKLNSGGALDLACSICAGTQPYAAKTYEEFVGHVRQAHCGLRPFFCDEDCQGQIWYAPLVFERLQRSLTDTCVVVFSGSRTKRSCKGIASRTNKSCKGIASR